MKDEFGGIKRYDGEGNVVTILPGEVIVRHDVDGYRVERDINGRLHRFDV